MPRHVTDNKDDGNDNDDGNGNGEVGSWRLRLFFRQ